MSPVWLGRFSGRGARRVADLPGLRGAGQHRGEDGPGGRGAPGVGPASLEPCRRAWVGSARPKAGSRSFLGSARTQPVPPAVRSTMGVLVGSCRNSSLRVAYNKGGGREEV